MVTKTDIREAAQFVESAIKEFVRNSPLNRMPDNTSQPIFEEPLVQYADADDPLFTQYKTIIAPTHLTPREALAQAVPARRSAFRHAGVGKTPDELPQRLSVISWVLPVAGKTRQTNRAEKRLPSRMWAYTRWYGEQFNDALRNHVVKLLHEKGYLATTPVLQPYFTQFRNDGDGAASLPKGPYSNWSERHVAYVAGLGTFSLSDGFITERGIAHRVGSVVTDLILPPSPRTASTAFSNCLYYADGSCVACVKRCPAGAITEAGHDKDLCRQYQTEQFAAMRQELQVGNTGCGLCQTKVPCENGIPRRAKQS